MVAPVHGQVILHLGYVAHYSGTLPCFFSFDMHQCRFLVYQLKVSVFECLICCLCCLLLIWYLFQILLLSDLIHDSRALLKVKFKMLRIPTNCLLQKSQRGAMGNLADSTVEEYKIIIIFFFFLLRSLISILHHEQFMNLVVGNPVEVNGNEKNDIGMVVILGNSVVTVEALEPVNRSI
ncbi:hypothetical protein KIW84_012776 [Lathyrus oleraceus]|uniref:Uncharacterized protein n=1 Tax=Pisum sativum TaxID=3888 RepID=A0A9D5GX82_PEA|nr:hypothetical protein KIW84_012776 [Pisum sativum]